MNLEVYVIPVSDVERSKQFYQQLGWRLEEDVAPAQDDMRSDNKGHLHEREGCCGG